jgi:hypothetical protein
MSCMYVLTAPEPGEDARSQDDYDPRNPHVGCTTTETVLREAMQAQAHMLARIVVSTDLAVEEEPHQAVRALYTDNAHVFPRFI